jgi:hypothetical protein
MKESWAEKENARRFGKTTFVLCEFRPRSAVRLSDGDEDQMWMSEDRTIYIYDKLTRKWSRLTNMVFVVPRPWGED